MFDFPNLRIKEHLYFPSFYLPYNIHNNWQGRLEIKSEKDGVLVSVVAVPPTTTPTTHNPLHFWHPMTISLLLKMTNDIELVTIGISTGSFSFQSPNFLLNYNLWSLYSTREISKFENILKISIWNFDAKITLK